jgi:subtilisin family serine protease
MLLIASPAAAAESDATVTMSWSASRIVRELPLLPDHAGIHVVVAGVEGAESCDLSFDWTGLPDASGEVRIGWRSSDRPDEWLYAVRRRADDGTLLDTRCTIEGWESYTGGTLRLFVPVQFEGFDPSTPCWIVLARLSITTPEGTRSLRPAGTQLAMNGGGLPPPPVVWQVDPPQMATQPGRSQGVFLLGERLDEVATAQLRRADDTATLVPRSRETRTPELVRLEVEAGREHDGGWLWDCIDPWGRRIGGSHALALWDGNAPVRDADGVVIPGARDLHLEDVVPGEILVSCAPHAVTFPEERIAESVSLSDIVISPAFEKALNSIGATRMERVFKRPPDSPFWGRAVTDDDRRRSAPLRNIYKLHVPIERDLRSAIEGLRAHGDVVWAEPNGRYAATVAPTDSLYCLEQWPLCSSLSQYHIGIENAWNRSVGNAGIKLAIIDTGIDYNHADLGGGFGDGYPVRGGWDYVNNDNNPMDDHQDNLGRDSHGTHVSATAAGLTANGGYGVAGVAGGWGTYGWTGCQMFALKVLAGDTGGGTWENVALAIAEAGWGYGVDVSNLSLGGLNAYSETVRIAMLSAYGDGVTGVCAKGNDGSTDPNYPSDYFPERSVSVGAYNNGGGHYVNSNRGHGIAVSAPGVQVMSARRTVYTPQFGNKTGTSMAAPHVTGEAGVLLTRALFIEGGPIPLSPEDVKNLIQLSAAATGDPGDPGYDDLWGWGRINVDETLKRIEPPWSFDHFAAAGGTGTQDFEGDVYFSNAIGGPLNGMYAVKRYDVRRNVTFPVNYGEVPSVWGRGEPDGIGYSGVQPVYGDDYCSVVPGTVTLTGCQLKTYVYDVYTTLGQHVGWFPSTPAGALFQYSVVGKPQYIVGTPEVELATATEALLRVVPQPVRGAADIRYRIVQDPVARLTVFDVRGAVVRVLGDVRGTGALKWDGRDQVGRPLPGGVYFVELRGENERAVAKSILVR